MGGGSELIISAVVVAHSTTKQGNVFVPLKDFKKVRAVFKDAQHCTWGAGIFKDNTYSPLTENAVGNSELEFDVTDPDASFYVRTYSSNYKADSGYGLVKTEIHLYR